MKLTKLEATLCLGILSTIGLTSYRVICYADRMEEEINRTKQISPYSIDTNKDGIFSAQEMDIYNAKLTERDLFRFP